MGMPLLVKAISFPYIACGVISIEGDELGPVVVDVRKIRVCVLSGEYVTALTTSKRKPVHRRYDSDEVPF